MKTIFCNFFFILLSLLTNTNLKAFQTQSKNVTIVNINNKRIRIERISAGVYNDLLSNAFKQIIKDTQIIKRNGVIKIRLLNGKDISFKDIVNDEVKNKEFSLGGIIGNRFYVIVGKYYDNGEDFIIDKFNGSVTPLWGDPLISPDGTHILSFFAALGYDMMPNGLQMYNVKGRPRLDWEYKIDNWEPKSVRWINNNTIIVCKSVPKEISKSHQIEKEYLKISF